MKKIEVAAKYPWKVLDRGAASQTTVITRLSQAWLKKLQQIYLSTEKTSPIHTMRRTKNAN